MLNQENYSVGYGKPPVHTRFKKGQSGNKKGRPKRPAKLKNPADILPKIMNQKVTITINGKKVEMTIYESLFHQLAFQAVAGHPKHQKLLMEYIEKYIGFDTAEELVQRKKNADEVIRHLLQDYLPKQLPEYMI